MGSAPKNVLGEALAYARRGHELVSFWLSAEWGA